MRKIFEEFKEYLNSENNKRKISDLEKEDKTLEEYNGRQFLEMLQNIDDQESEEALIKLDTKNKIILIANNKIPFSSEGLESLMMPNVSSKRNKINFIGNKGLGFRSLLNWAGEIYVKSKNLSIEFSEKNRDRLQSDGERAILSAPEWIDLHNSREWINNIIFSDKYITYIAVHYTKESEQEILEQLDKISEELLFFINNLKEIIIYIDNKKTIYRKKKWKIETLKKKLPQEFQKKKNSDDHYQIKIAFPPNNENVNYHLFSYFPTKIKIKFPVLIHATLELDSSRNQISKLKRNKFIVEEIAHFLILNAKKLKNKVSNWKAYEFLKVKDEHKNEILEEFGFYKIIEEWKETAEIYPCIDNTYRNFKCVYFYNNKFSDFMENHSEILGNIIKRNSYKEKYSRIHKDLITPLIQISKKIISIEERVKFINQIFLLKYDKPDLISKKLPLLINQDKKLKEELFFYDDIFQSLNIPEFIQINYIYPALQRQQNKSKLQKIANVRNFDLEKDLINLVITSSQTIQIKLKALYNIFIADIKKPNRISESISEISGKYLRDERILEICEIQSIINNYEKLEIADFQDLDNFLFWLGGKKFNAKEILNKVIAENNRKQNIKKSLQSLFILKNNFDDERIRTIEKIFAFDGNGLIEDVSKLFPYNDNCEKNNIIAPKSVLGLTQYQNEEIKKFLEWLKIKEFNPENIATEKIKLLRKRDLNKSKIKPILKFLYKSRENNEIHFTPDINNIYIYGKLSNKLFLRTELTKKYFDNDELIFDYSYLGLIQSKNSDKFLKWLGVKEATKNKIIKAIFESKISEIDKLKDLIKIYKGEIKPDLEFKLQAKDGNYKDVKTLYLDNENSKFCKSEKIIAKFDFEVSEDFLKWLGVSEPTNKKLVERFLELLSKENNISVEDRKEIIMLLSKKYKNQKRDRKQILFLLNNQNQIRKNSELYQETEIAKKHIPNNLINTSLKLDKDFLEWLGVEKANPKRIIKSLLKNNNPNYRDIFEIWKNEKDSIGKKFNDNKSLKIIVKLPNRYENHIYTTNLFLKKDETPFYDKNELIAEFKDLGLDIFDKNKVEDFLVWLGVNRYIKYIEENYLKQVYKLSNISKLEFNKLILLLEKDNFLKNIGALKYLQKSFHKYQYWILENYGISLINPPLEYKNNTTRILLEQFGIKSDFDEKNSLFILQNLFQIDTKGEFAPQIYKEILNKNLTFKYEHFQLFTKNKDYQDNKSIFYLDNSEQPKYIQNQYALIDLPINLNNIDKIINTFGVKKFPIFDYKIENFEKIDSLEFYTYFKQLKPYFLAFGTFDTDSKEIKNLAQKLKNLHIKLGNFDCIVNNEKIEIEDFEMVFFENSFYIKADKFNDDSPKNETLTNSIENILLTIFEENKNFTNIFRYADFEHLDKIIEKEYGSNVLEEAKKLLTLQYIKENNILPKISQKEIEKKFEQNSFFRDNNFSKTGYQKGDYSTFSQKEQENFKKKAGKEAENMVKEKFPHYKQVSGYVNGDDRLGYDFEYIDNQGIKHFVEVKNFQNFHFYMTTNEIRVAKEKKNNYHIYLVLGETIYDIGNIFNRQIKNGLKC